MRNFILLSTLLISSFYTSAENFKSKQPVIIHGQVYDAVLTLSQNDKSDDSKKIISVSFFLLCADKENFANYEGVGGFQRVKKTYTSSDNSNGILTLLPEQSSLNTRQFNFPTCEANISKYKISLTLIGNEKLKIDFIKSAVGVVEMEDQDYYPESYMDDEYANYMKSTVSNDNGIGSKVMPHIACNYIPRFAGNIDSKDFPANQQLFNFLNNNEDFVFKMTMDLYMDIVRFRANMCDYQVEKIKTFLLTHDLNYLRYEKNEDVLSKKIAACGNLLKQACRKINLGDIFYKDFPIDHYENGPELYKFSASLKDDYYDTKKVKGEGDNFYKENALNIYLANWASFEELQIGNEQKKDFAAALSSSSKPLIMRVFFLIQPFGAYLPVGDFKGVTAYAIKGLLYCPCSKQPFLSPENRYLGNIEDPVVKRCYVNGINFLNEYLKKQHWNMPEKVLSIYENDYMELGNWQQPFTGCNAGYNYMAGKIKKQANGERILCLRLMTNYNVTFQPGYEVVFSDTINGMNFKLPVTDASIQITGKKSGFCNLQIKIPPDIYTKIVEKGINNISFQCTGEPQYLIPHDYFYNNPNEVISEDVDTIKTSFVTAQDSKKIMDFLKQAL